MCSTSVKMVSKRTSPCLTLYLWVKSHLLTLAVIVQKSGGEGVSNFHCVCIYGNIPSKLNMHKINNKSVFGCIIRISISLTPNRNFTL